MNDIKNEQTNFKEHKKRINGLGIAQIVVPIVFTLLSLAGYLTAKYATVSGTEVIGFIFGVLYGFILLFAGIALVIFFEIIATIIQLVLHYKHKNEQFEEKKDKNEQF